MTKMDGKKGRDPRRYYGIIEDKIEAEGSGGLRSSLLIDCVDADRFETSARAIDDPSALALVRAMTTDHVWSDRLNAGNVMKGDWVEFQLDDEGEAPLAWEMIAAEDYRRGPKRSLRTIRRVGRAGSTYRPDRDDFLVKSLHEASNSERGRHQRIQLTDISGRIDGDPREQINIVVLDVGQAGAVLIRRGQRPIALFDVGAPLWFNKGSVALGMTPPALGDGFIFLSHWDFDHFDMGRRHSPYHAHDWFAPDQPVSPNTAFFQKKLGARLTFVDGSLAIGGFCFRRGTASDPLDRNNSGYQLRYDHQGDAVLLTGDADYDFIDPAMLAGTTHLLLPHHGGKGSAPPQAAGARHAVVSYGLPNHYRHPNMAQMTAHRAARWRVLPTAPCHIDRGNRMLYPTPPYDGFCP
ncbi:hypothetical protein [Sphingopyxis sp. JAI108]|uniref:hypothetical protein n=1 Tax=Sphingopyxis sp. JAI108 TaxID=2723060 RepID=UPI0015CE0BCE|nr:hypothetical protein [Sphingopyxis sp. JAI108]NYF33817.1 beta-lactamase superfamily II metal-dependent hydrolase [Sphingopyxis sp. JAI108]